MRPLKSSKCGIPSKYAFFFFLPHACSLFLTLAGGIFYLQNVFSHAYYLFFYEKKKRIFFADARVKNNNIFRTYIFGSYIFFFSRIIIYIIIVFVCVSILRIFFECASFLSHI